MKNYLFFMSLWLFALGSSMAGTVEKTYSYGEYTVKSINGYQLIELKNTQLFGKPGEPTLPYQEVVLLLNPGEIAESIEIIPLDEILIPGSFQLYPQQNYQTVSGGNSGNFIKDQQVYSTDVVYPANLCTGVNTSFLRGHSIAMAVFTPFRYNPAKGLVSYFSKVKVKITTKTAPKATEAVRLMRTGITSDRLLNNFIQNPEILKNYHKISIKGDDDYDVLIVTSAQIQSGFANLRTDYLRRGLITRLITVEQINNMVSGSDLQEKIRNYIIDQYQNHSLEYVLLGGDNEVVPARGFYCTVQSSSVMTDDNIPADLYYSALDGNWNTDGDDLWAEPEEDDLLPDIAVGRLPVSNIAELTSMTHKILSYQNNPVENELNKPFLVGEKLYDDPLTWGSQYLELLIGIHDDNGYTTSGIPASQPIEKLYDANNYEWTLATLLQKINSGKSFIHHVGHANETYVMRLYNSDITNQNFSQVNGTTHNYTLMYTHGCICGAFDVSDCIAEEMLKINNFAVAFIGNSRYGWFNEGQTEGPSTHLHREFVNALYAMQENHLGTTHMISKIQSAPWVEAGGQWEPGAIRWVFYDCNVLGDPTLQIWTNAPADYQVSYDTSLTMGSTSMTLTLNGLFDYSGYWAALISGDKKLGMAMAEANGTINLQLDFPVTQLGEAKLIVGGYNNYTSEYTITVIPSSGPYLVLNHFEVIDNNNQEADCGETFQIKPWLQNMGLNNASNVKASLSTNDTNLVLLDTLVELSEITAGGILSSSSLFRLQAAADVEDQYEAEMHVNIQSDDSLQWTSKFKFKINAPQITLGSLILDDSDGDNDQILDLQENFKLIVPVFNSGHAPSENISVTLSCTNPFITIVNPIMDINPLEGGTGQMANFEIQTAAGLVVGNLVNFSVQVVSGENTENSTMGFLVGLRAENFEQGNFSLYPWTFPGIQPWTITNSGHEGNYSAKSGLIQNNQASAMQVNIAVQASGTISFWSKVSSEATYDKLKFYIDGTLKDEWSGEINWANHSYNVLTGNHTFKWEYSKDGSVSTGDDCAWVDYIVFPPSNANQTAGLMLNTTFLTKTMETNATDSAQIQFMNTGTANLNFLVKIEPLVTSWFTSNITSGTLEPFGIGEGLFHFNTSGLAIGKYDASVEVIFGDTLLVPVQLKVVSFNGIPDESLNPNVLSAYPNPFTSDILISLSGKIIRSYVWITDLTGKTIRRITVPAHSASTLTVHWNGTSQTGVSVPAGVYLCSWVTGNEIKTVRLIKTK